MATRYVYLTGGREVTLDDPTDAYTAEQIKQHWAATFPELSAATWDTKEVDGVKVVTFAKKVGTKGMGRDGILAAVERERAYQDGKWGTIEERPHTVGEWLLIVERELQEAKEAWCKGAGDGGALAELLQATAVAFACFEQHGVIERGQAIWSSDHWGPQR